MNSLMVITPYRHGTKWVFDDASKGLDKEPFVAGSDTIIEILALGRDTFTLVFSSQPFPSAKYRLKWTQEFMNGNWYHCPELQMDGWLCPALLKYFDTPPMEIFVDND
jgi:hypothetical protein